MKKGLLILVLSFGVLCFNTNVLSTGFSTSTFSKIADSTMDDKPGAPNITGFDC